MVVLEGKKASLKLFLGLEKEIEGAATKRGVRTSLDTK